MFWLEISEKTNRDENVLVPVYKEKKKGEKEV
jgi:hypothetical protein